MTILQAILLGCVQGLTEFIPVSSSAHLWLLQSFMHLDVDATAFDIVLHLGTALALIVNFARELAGMVRELARWVLRRPSVDAENRALILPLIMGTIPGVLMGVTLLHWSEEFRSYLTVGITMLAAACMFVIAERFRGERRVPTAGGAVLIGIAQGVAGLFPGFSRSGLTISTGMLTKLRRDCSARFSFLLALPIILGAGAKTLLDLHGNAHALPALSVLAAGFITSAIVGTLVIRLLLAFLVKHSLRPFAAYLLLLGVTLIALASAGALHR